MNTPGPEVTTNDPNTIQVTTAASSPAVANGAPAPAPYAGAARPPGAPVSSGKEQSLGVGTEGEVAVWKGRYSFKNFIMRIVIRTVVTIAWLGLLGYLGDRYHRPGHSDWELFVWITGAAVVLFWLVLG